MKLRLSLSLWMSLLTLFVFAGCASINRNERQTLAVHNVSPVVYDKMMHGAVLSLDDIMELSQRQVPPPLIIHYLSSTRAIYNLDKPALARLNRCKVSQDVVDYLLETPSLFGPRAYPYAYYGPRPYYPYDYYPYPYYYGPTSVVVVGGGRWHRW